MIEVITGQPVGTFGLIVVRELPPVIHEKYRERRVEVICPICNNPFTTNLRNLTKKDNNKKRPVRMCPSCAAKYVAELSRLRGIGQIEDLSGQRFGNLQALYPLEERKRRSVVWHCKCDCGGTKDVIQVDLKRGHTTHCNLCSKNGGFGQPKNLSGLKFGKLTPLYPTEQRWHNSVVWYCYCDCGNYCYKSCDTLSKGNSQSCGCLVSKGESRLISLFTVLDIKYIAQKSFEDCVNPITGAKLKFDFYLPEYNCCIEYDGIQHFEYNDSGWDTKEDFENRIFRDKIKNEYCKIHNIRLIRIPYWDFDSMNEDYLLSKLNFLL